MTQLQKSPTAWIIGGSSGIGLELSKRFLQDGYQLCIFAHAGVEEVVTRLQQLSPVVRGYLVDVQQEVTLETMFTQAAQQFGAPTIVINSAGISVAKSFEEMTSQEFERQININLIGSRNVAHAALPFLYQARTLTVKNPKLVLIASAAGLVGCYGYTGYCSSKFGVVGLAEVLRMELRSKDIDVAVVCPPEVDTPLVEAERKHGSQITAQLKQLGGSMPVTKACQEIYDGIQTSQFMIMPGTQARILTKIARVLPDLYRGQIDKKLDKIIEQYG